jgi:circadian clock protein KaiB
MTQALNDDKQKDALAETWELTLYTFGQSPKSRNTLTALENICNEYIKGKCKIDVIDLQKTPQFAMEHQILAIPTIIRKNPKPIKKVIGDLSNLKQALIMLEIESTSKDANFEQVINKQAKLVFLNWEN